MTPQPDGSPMTLLFRQNRLIAVETVSAPGQQMAARRMIGAPRQALAASGYDLREALKAGTA